MPRTEGAASKTPAFLTAWEAVPHLPNPNKPASSTGCLKMEVSGENEMEAEDM